jgi:hypothetical protein
MKFDNRTAARIAAVAAPALAAFMAGACAGGSWQLGSGGIDVGTTGIGARAINTGAGAGGAAGAVDTTTADAAAAFARAAEKLGASRVALAVHDQRAEVRDGRKPPSWAGLTHTGTGVPRPALTRSGRPLAEELADAVAAQFSAAGVQVVRVPSGATEAAATVRERAAATLAGSGRLRSASDGGTAATRTAAPAPTSDRALVFTLHEWSLDAVRRSTLSWDVELVATDPAAAFQGAERLGGNDLLGPGQNPARLNLDTAVADIFGGLIAGVAGQR